jgi:hypothetical protein
MQDRIADVENVPVCYRSRVSQKELKKTAAHGRRIAGFSLTLVNSATVFNPTHSVDEMIYLIMRVVKR